MSCTMHCAGIKMQVVVLGATRFHLQQQFFHGLLSVRCDSCMQTRQGMTRTSNQPAIALLKQLSLVYMRCNETGTLASKA